MTGSVWSEEQELTGTDVAAGDAFGLAVGVEGSRIVVGAPQDDDLAPDSGAVYVFVEPVSADPSRGKP